MSLKDFQIISKLGEGAYSSVYQVKRRMDGKDYALKKVKIMDLSEKEKQNALNEVRILASIRHPNIVQFKEAFIEENSNSLCIIMEYLDNGDLYQKIVEHQKQGTFFKENEIWSIFIQMIQGLKVLHEMNIFHRDMKSANIFLNKNGTAKLGDLNVSKVAKKGVLYTQTGTPYYASPEVWKDQPYDEKSDIWSLGCVLYEMTTLKPPFRAEDMEGLYKKVLKGYYPRIPSNFSQDLNNMIRALLQVSPQLRPTCGRLLLLSAVVKRMEEKYLLEAEDIQNILLSTIRIPKNINFLIDRLPIANYEPLKIRQQNKSRLLATIAGEKNSPKESLYKELQTRLIKGSESVDTNKRDKLPPLDREQEESFKIYNPKERRYHPIHRANLNEMNDGSLVQIEKEVIRQKYLLAEHKKAGQARKNKGLSNNSQSAKQILYDLELRSPSIGKREKLIPGYAIHYLNDEALIEENMARISDSKKILGQKAGRGEEEQIRLEKKRPEYKSPKNIENSLYLNKKSIDIIGEAEKSPQSIGIKQRRLLSISPDPHGKPGGLPHISRQVNSILYNYDRSPYKNKLGEPKKLSKSSLAPLEESVGKFKKVTVVTKADPLIEHQEQGDPIKPYITHLNSKAQQSKNYLK